MKVQYASDIHLEFRSYGDRILRTSGDILCLAGDICACGIPSEFVKFTRFIEMVAPNYKYVFHIAGNHEYYSDPYNASSNTMTLINNKLRNISKSVPNYVYLNKGAYDFTVDGTQYRVIGATLWTHIPPQVTQQIQSSLNDYFCIYAKGKRPGSDALQTVNINVDTVNRMHREHVKFIMDTLKSTPSGKSVILMTHHKPIIEQSTDAENYVNFAYETDLIERLEPFADIIKLAIHGHTHKKYHKVVNGILCVSNPKGYVRQRTEFDEKVVELV